MKNLHIVAMVLVAGAVGRGFAGEPNLKWLPVERLKVDQVNPVLLFSKEFAKEQSDAKRPGVAVRGIYPLATQEKILKETYKAFDKAFFFPFPPISRIAIKDFILERQVLPHDAVEKHSEIPWEKVDVQQTFRILEKAESFADDVIAEEGIHYVVTMPLPSRKDGKWDSSVSHPALGGQPKSGHVLFRFIDFDVKPNTYYRYRVRLKVYNPLYAKETENPFLSAGMYRETPWSQPSPAIVVTSVKPGN